jgi:N-acetylneuraminate lyase
MNKTGLKGIIPAVVTPIDAKERFAPAAFEALLEKVYSAGVHGIYVCGQTGEGLLQTVEQRKSVAEASMRYSPKGKQVIVHVGAYRTADAVELARHAHGIGVTAVSALPPLGPYSFEEIHAYYQEIAAASDLPVLVYYFPEVCPAIKTAEQILQLCAIPNVVGLKFTDFDLYRMRYIKQRGALIFNGRDEVLSAGLLMGADGGIGTFYNIVPELFVELYNHALRGNWIGACAVQDRVNAIVRATLRFPVFPAIKQILRWSGVECGRCIRPRAGLTPEQTSELRRSLEECGLEVDRPVVSV